MRKFLCLPGALTNAQTMSIQLGPIVNELESDKSASFHFTQGIIEESPPEDIAFWFGTPPHLRFFKYEAGVEPLSILNGLRDFEHDGTPEEAMREFLGDDSAPLREDVQRMLDDLYRTIKEHGPFYGLIGYSEGATVAATLIVDDLKRRQAEGLSGSSFQCAVFFHGWPPLSTEGKSTLLLSDEVGELITIPTFHVVGASDPYLVGSMALYSVCDSNTAEMFDHGMGHMVPRESVTVKELSDRLRGFWNEIEEES
ncbi:putative ef-hand calcium-binding domain protein [Seiridium cardinale]